MPVGGGGAWPGFEIDHSEPSGSRVAISRAGRRPRAHKAARPGAAARATGANLVGPGSQVREPAATHSPDQSSRRRLCSGHRMACPPARRPRRELRSARRFEARPCPAGPAPPVLSLVRGRIVFRLFSASPRSTARPCRPRAARVEPGSSFAHSPPRPSQGRSRGRPTVRRIGLMYVFGPVFAPQWRMSDPSSTTPICCPLATLSPTLTEAVTGR